MLEKVKVALRITTNAFDSDLEDLIQSALADLHVVGIVGADDDPLIRIAVITYCRMRFGSPDDYDRLEKAYRYQKGQLKTSSRYTAPTEVGDGTSGCY